MENSPLLDQALQEIQMDQAVTEVDHICSTEGPIRTRYSRRCTIYKYREKFEGAKGPKMKIQIHSKAIETDATRFIRQCKVYFVTKRKEFTSEMDKMLWITSLCDGEAVEGWVDWITQC